MISILMASKKEVVCIFCITTSTISKRRFYDVFRVKIVIERAATSSKSSMKYLHASVACIKVFREQLLCPDLINNCLLKLSIVSTILSEQGRSFQSRMPAGRKEL